MKNFSFIIVSFLSGFFCSYGQQEKLDSLHLKLHQHETEDSIKIDILNDLAYNYYLLDPVAGIHYADSAITLATKLQDKKRLGKAYSYKGHNLSATGQDSAALALYDESIRIYKSINDFNGLARTRFSQGLIYFGRADYEKSTQKHQQALEYFRKEKDTFLMGKMWNSIGINYMYLNDYARSLESYLKAADYYEASGHSASIEQAGIFANIGILYKNLKNYDLALEYQDRALTIYKKEDFKSGMANALISIGNIYDSKKEPQKAIEQYHEAYLIGEAISNKRIMAASLTNTGIAYHSLGKYELAVQHLNHTRNIYEDLGDDHNLSIIYNYLGEAYSAMDVNREKELHPEDLFKKALWHSKAADSPQNQSRALDNLSEIYFQNRQYKDAYDTKIKAIELRDSIFSIEKKEEIVELQVQHEYQKKEAILRSETEKAQAMAALEIDRQKLIRNFTILTGSGLVILAVVGLFFYKRHRDVKQLTRESNFNARIADTELKALRSQMNPHFIFNSLNSIKDFISKHETRIAENYLAKFAKLMRLTLESSEKDLLPLEEDLHMITLYMELEAVRLEDKFTYMIDVDQDIDPENTLVPPLLLQPFVENSIWHGLSKKVGKGKITIRIKKQKNGILCIVEDDGVGLKTSHLTRNRDKKPLGIKISRTRLEILNERRNTNASICVIPKEQGLRIEVQLPLELAS